MPKLTPIQSINKAYRQVPIIKNDLVRFKEILSKLLSKTTDGNTEENQKNNLRDFLMDTFFGNYEVNEKRPIDLAIHTGKNTDTPIGVIIEAKSTTNLNEMVTTDDLNRKAMQELVYYYLLERVEKRNNEICHLVATNMYEFFIFDAQDFERFFYQNKQLLKQFKIFRQGGTTNSSTKHFYDEIVPDYIAHVADSINYTYFDIRHYRKYIENDEIDKLTPLYRIFSDTHLLKLPFQNDSNSLDKVFYVELLHIMGLEEVKEQNKMIIKRKTIEQREEASLLENTIEQIDDRIYKLGSLNQYGDNREEQLFTIALELCITWINRVLFLKLLESQLLKYHNGDSTYRFLSKDKITDFDQMNDLFFKVLAKNYEDRKLSLIEKFPNVPYLNSSLFETTMLEDRLIEINALSQTMQLSIPSNSVLRKTGCPYAKQKSLPLLDYLFAFLDAYNFSSEGIGEIQEESKTLINASVLGLIFEKINGHKDGAVFTPGYITMYMSHEVLSHVVIQKFNETCEWGCTNMDELYNHIDKMADDSRANDIINSIKICDPAVGSGHFLVSALNELIRLKYDLGILVDEKGRRISRRDYYIDIENDELMITEAESGQPFEYHPNNKESQRIQRMLFREKQQIIENCLFGVDINPNSVNICRLRLWIELLKNSYYTEESGMRYLETLPNIDINIKCGNSLLQRFSIETDLRKILRDAHISINKYKEVVDKYKNVANKQEKFEITDIINSIKGSIKTHISQTDSKLISLNRKRMELGDLQSEDLFGYTDKEQKAKEKRIQILKADIDKLEAYFDDIKNNRSYKGAFEWRFEFPELLNNEGDFMGFDCIIGNPPYIQLQANSGELANLLANSGYETFERTGDIYCLFYEQGYHLLKPHGTLCFITSNKWMRASYGKATRNFLATKTNPLLLVDFAGIKVFDSATVDVNILMYDKNKNNHETICSIIKQDSLMKLSDFVQQQNTICNFTKSESWVILSPIEQSIKSKIESVGIPLKDWNIQINYGIKTGYNDAFIIDSNKREEILKNCRTEEERTRTVELIRPILRGRDIKRYGYVENGLYLINTHNGIRGRIPRINIEDYPAIKTHLDQYWDKIKKRADQGDTPYNLRNCVYLEDFSRPKIVWGNLNLKASYALIEDDSFINAPSPMIVPASNYLLGVLNSKLADYYIRKLGVTRNGGYFEYKPMFVEQLPVPIESELILPIEKNVILRNEEQIDYLIYNLYGLSEEEIQYINSRDD